jgi:hypothetical protein
MQEYRYGKGMYGKVLKKKKGKGNKCSGIVIANQYWAGKNLGGRSAVANDVTNPDQREVKGRPVP